MYISDDKIVFFSRSGFPPRFHVTLPLRTRGFFMRGKGKNVALWLLHFLGILIILMFSIYRWCKRITVPIFIYTLVNAGYRPHSRFYCLKGANCICLDNELYESNTAFFFMNQGRIQDDFWKGFIWSNFRTYSTYSDRHAWANSVDPDQTPQNAFKPSLKRWCI